VPAKISPAPGIQVRFTFINAILCLFLLLSMRFCVVSEGETEAEALENLKDATLGVLTVQAQMASQSAPKLLKPCGSRRGSFELQFA